jgi:hypothetical protein
MQNNSDVNINSNFPYPRWGATLNSLGNCLILFGGRNKLDFNDLWLYNLDKLEWKPINSFTKEIAVERRKHCSTIYRNLIIISGGFNGEYLDEINFLNLNDLSVCNNYYHSSIYDIFKFINNPSYSDFQIKNVSSIFNCHKHLFFRRIKQEEIVNSSFLRNAFSLAKCNMPIDTSDYNLYFPDITFFHLLEILYVGYLSKYLIMADFKNLFLLCNKIGLYSISRKIINLLYIDKNKKLYFQNMNNYCSNSYIAFDILYGGNCEMKDLVYHNINAVQFPVIINTFNLISFKSSTLKFIFDFIFNSSQIGIPEGIVKIIIDYIQYDRLPIVREDNFIIFFELLFYSDFLCLESLFNVN